MSAALERRSGALVDREAGAGDLGAAGVVDDVERLAELPVRPRVQVAPPAGASAPTSPTSGWSWASCSPHIRSVTLASSPPTGMSRSGGFGMRRSRSSRSPSVSAREASSAVIRTPAAVEAARRSATSGPSGAAPPLIASPICFETVFRSALRASFSASSRRRSASSSMARSTSAGSSPLSDGALADGVRLLAEPLQADAHAGGPPSAVQPGRFRTLAPSTNSGSRPARSQPARGPFGRPRNAR